MSRTSEFIRQRNFLIKAESKRIDGKKWNFQHLESVFYLSRKQRIPKELSASSTMFLLLGNEENPEKQDRKDKSWAGILMKLSQR